jgi:hypothetical protein
MGTYYRFAGVTHPKHVKPRVTGPRRGLTRLTLCDPVSAITWRRPEGSIMVTYYTTTCNR